MAENFNICIGTQAAQSKVECAGHMTQFGLENTNEMAVETLNDFLYLVSRTDDTEVLHRFLTEFLNQNPCKGDRIAAIQALYQIIRPQQRFVFLSLIDAHYPDKSEFGSVSSDNPKDMAHLPNALQALTVTHRKMEQKTKWQSYGMMLGGVTFGMEVVMLGLERVAWSDNAAHPEVILALVFAGFLVLGYPMGRFFKSAHHDALDKQNKELFFEAQYGQEAGQSQLVLFRERMKVRPGYAVAAFGVLAEGLLVFRGILSGTGFVADMFTLSIDNGDYENKIPGTYFMDAHPVMGGIFCMVATLFALAVSYSLMSGHFALDGRECCEHEEKKGRGSASPRHA